MLNGIPRGVAGAGMGCKAPLSAPTEAQLFPGPTSPPPGTAESQPATLRPWSSVQKTRVCYCQTRSQESNESAEGIGGSQTRARGRTQSRGQTLAWGRILGSIRRHSELLAAGKPSSNRPPHRPGLCWLPVHLSSPELPSNICQSNPRS